MRLHRCLLLALGIVLAMPSVAFADDADRAAALKKRGDEALDALHPREALDAYNEAYELTHDPAIAYNRGRALQVLGRYAEALDAFETFTTTAPPDLRAKVTGVDALLADLRARVATLSITTTPAGADVLLDGKKIGVAPLETRVTAGAVHVEAMKADHEHATADVNVSGGSRSAVQLALPLLATMATLRVTSAQRGGHVLLDGEPMGDTPLELETKRGQHRIEVRHANAQTFRTTLLVGPGEHREIDASVAEETPITRRWWFWTVIGVAVAGGVVGTVLAVTTEKSPSDGNVPPGRLATGLSF